MDEVGRPLYGDVFGLEQQESGQGVQLDEEVDRTLWGELESEEEEEEEEEEVGGRVIVTCVSHDVCVCVCVYRSQKKKKSQSLKTLLLVL